MAFGLCRRSDAVLILSFPEIHNNSLLFGSVSTHPGLFSFLTFENPQHQLEYDVFLYMFVMWLTSAYRPLQAPRSPNSHLESHIWYFTTLKFFLWNFRSMQFSMWQLHMCMPYIFCVCVFRTTSARQSGVAIRNFIGKTNCKLHFVVQSKRNFLHSNTRLHSCK